VKETSFSSGVKVGGYFYYSQFETVGVYQRVYSIMPAVHSES